MKKFIAFAILLMSAAAFVPAAEAKTDSISAPQIRVQIGRGNRRFNRRVRVVTQTRNVRVGRNLYRETYRTTYRANGRTNTRLISRVLIRRY